MDGTPGLLRGFEQEEDDDNTMSYTPYTRSPSRSPAHSPRSPSRASTALSPPRTSTLLASQHHSPTRTAHSSYLASRRGSPPRHSQLHDSTMVSSEPYQMYTSPPASQSAPGSPRINSPPRSPKMNDYLPKFSSPSAGGNLGVSSVQRLPLYNSDGRERGGLSLTPRPSPVSSPGGKGGTNGRLGSPKSPRILSPRISPTGRIRGSVGRAPPALSASTKASKTTDLHAVCASPSSSLGKLKATLLAQGTPAASRRNADGRTPLHILGRNELLIQLFLSHAKYEDAGTGGSKVIADHMSFGSGNASVVSGGGDAAISITELDSFIIDLVKAYPRAVISSDTDGQIPFTKAIIEWIKNSCGNDLDDDDDDIGNNGSPNGDVAHGIGRPGVSGMGQTSFDGMEQVVANERAATRNGNQRSRPGIDEGIRLGDDLTFESRSLLTNLTLPTAFRSVYSSSKEMPAGSVSRATYRKRVGRSNALNDPSIGSDYEDNPARPRRTKDGISFAIPFRDSNDSRPGGKNANEAHFRDENQLSASGGTYAGVGSSLVSLSTADSGCSIDDFFPLNIRMPAMVEWSLRILSIILNSFDAMNSMEETSLRAWQTEQRQREEERPGFLGVGGNENTVITTTSGDNDWIGNTLVSAVASIPSLMKTLLLMDDRDPVKARVFNLSIVRRILSSRYTVGNWLVYMLEAVDINVARRAVDYLVILSNEDDDVDVARKRNRTGKLGTTATNTVVGAQLKLAERKNLYDKVSRLGYFLPAVLALEDPSEVDRAASTRIIRHILDKELSMRRSKIITLFDLFFLLLLLVSFHMGTVHLISDGSSSTKFAVIFYLSLSAIIYSVIRKIGQFSSLARISQDAMNNNFRWLDLVDWISIALALGGIIWTEIEINNGVSFDADTGQAIITDGMRSFLAAATGAIWMKIMVWIYIVNWDMTMFIRALMQIVYDARWFFFFLSIVVLAAAQMFYVMLSRQYPCDEGGFCDQKDSYLEVYAIAMGQFNLDDFSTTFSVIVFCAFTFLVLFVLAFMLIPIVVDSYTKTMTMRAESAECGARARLVYVGEISALRRLFERQWTLMQYCSVILFLSSTSVIFMFSAAGIRNSLDTYYGNTILAVCLSALVLFLLVSVAAFVSHMTYYDLEDSRGNSTTCWNRFVDSHFIRCLALPIDLLLRFLLGLNKDVLSRRGDSQWDDWHGGVSHIRSDVRHMIGLSECRTSALLRDEVNELESRMLKSSERVRTDVLTEIRSSEERLEKMIVELQSLLVQKDNFLPSSPRQSGSGSFHNSDISIQPGRSAEF